MTIPLRSDVVAIPKHITSLRVAAALPDGSRRARGQADWLRAVEAHPDVAALRVDAREHVTALAWALARTASWTELTTRPTWPQLEARTCLSRRTVARWLAWLRTAGLLGVVESGTTPQFSPMALLNGENRAAVYVLAVPSRAQAKRADASGPEVAEEQRPKLSTAESGTPTWSIPEGVDPDARARAAEPKPGPLRGPDCAEGGGPWPRTRAAGSRHDRLELVRRLQLDAPDLRRLTDRALRHLLRPWLLAGWTVAELLYALDHEPDGTERTWTTGVRSPSGWLICRLQAWTITPGVACSPPSVALRASESADLAAAAALSAERASASADRDASLDFGRRLEAVTGAALYAELLEVVTARLFAGARMRRTFAAAAAALVRGEIRAELCAGCRDNLDAHDPCQAAQASDEQLLTAARTVLDR